jgi:hypothetical protein
MNIEILLWSHHRGGPKCVDEALDGGSEKRFPEFDAFLLATDSGAFLG